MQENGHIHEDDLEMYSAGHLEPDRILGLEAHLSECQECQERLRQCLGPQFGRLEGHTRRPSGVREKRLPPRASRF